MEVTAMISDDPVEVTAIRIMITTRISPVLPINLCATIGGTKPATNIIIHSPKNMYHALLHCFHTALLNTLLSRKRLQENAHVHILLPSTIINKYRSVCMCISSMYDIIILTPLHHPR